MTTTIEEKGLFHERNPSNPKVPGILYGLTVPVFYLWLFFGLAGYMIYKTETYLVFTIGLVVVYFLTIIIQYIVAFLVYSDAVVFRPPLATNALCGNVINPNSICKSKNECGLIGFPSLHSTVAFYALGFMFPVVMGTKSITSQSRGIIILFLISYSILVAVSRFLIGCNTIFQIISGSIWGFVLGYGLYFIFDHYDPLENEKKLTLQVV